MEFSGYNEVDDESCDSYNSDDSSESDFDFDYDELVDSLDELELSDEDLDACLKKLNIFHNTFISSIMSRYRFLQIFYHLHFADSSLEVKKSELQIA
jgi:hypothetical protein